MKKLFVLRNKYYIKDQTIKQNNEDNIIK